MGKRREQEGGGTYLDMRLVQEPWLVGENFVDVVEVAQLLRYVGQAFQPVVVASLEEELLLLEGY